MPERRAPARTPSRTSRRPAPARTRPAPPRARDGEQAARRRRRRIALAVVRGSVAAVYGAALALTFASTWPGAPFPEPRGLASAVAVSVLAGVIVARAWALLLPLVLLVVGSSDGYGVFSGIVLLVVGGPYAITGMALGIGLGRALRRPFRRAQASPARAARPAPPARERTQPFSPVESPRPRRPRRREAPLPVR